MANSEDIYQHFPFSNDKQEIIDEKFNHLKKLLVNKSHSNAAITFHRLKKELKERKISYLDKSSDILPSFCLNLVEEIYTNDRFTFNCETFLYLSILEPCFTIFQNRFFTETYKISSGAKKLVYPSIIFSKINDFDKSRLYKELIKSEIFNGFEFISFKKLLSPVQNNLYIPWATTTIPTMLNLLFVGHTFGRSKVI